MIGVKADSGVTVRDVSPHAYGRLKERGVSVDGIVQALTSPLEITKIREDKRRRFIGEHITATAKVETGKLITVWATGEDKRDRLKRKRGLL